MAILAPELYINEKSWEHAATAYFWSGWVYQPLNLCILYLMYMDAYQRKLKEYREEVGMDSINKKWL